jgi:site-specific DNA-methyltransferase (adenine-specific)
MYFTKSNNEIILTKKGEALLAEKGMSFGDFKKHIENNSFQGRYPANLIHDGSDEVKECFPETKSGGYQNGSVMKTKKSTAEFLGGLNGKIECVSNLSGDNGTGNASRFFKSIIYQAKASKGERNAGCEDRESVKVNDGRQTPIDNAFQRGETIRVNSHPTIKPVKLIEYLVNMLTKEGQTVLDPFLGSGTTAIACEQLGRRWIGIELDEGYCEIAKARVEDITKQPRLL